MMARKPIRREKLPLPHLQLATMLIVAVFLAPSTAHSGVGPENVIVVVNADSHDSRTIANHYVELRNVPSINVIFLENIPQDLTITLEQFRNQILSPLFAQINARNLAQQSRVIAYSAGFPTSVGISEHAKRLTKEDQKKYQLPTASLTGLTYFYQYIIADSPNYLDFGSNFYARGAFSRHFSNPFLEPEKSKRFASAMADQSAGRHEAAASEFEKLFEESRTVSPLAILAAENRMRVGDSEAAGLLLEQAIAAGWTSGTYLDESDLLAPLLETKRMQQLRSFLNDYPTVFQEPVSFQSIVGWMNSGASGNSMRQGVPYIMACMLAVVHPRGSTVEQATEVLTRAASCDSTFPDASFWFTYTNDVRTNPRFPQLGDTLLWLKKTESDAEIIFSNMPNSKSGPCAGLMLGVADIPIDERKWSFVPGAISENLTSLSAKFDTPAQTKITKLLHAGAAMSCGPVFEPYNLPFKFPHAMMYGFYASGVSAIEAFYLSIRSPYQVLILGDPLAQPFAQSPVDWVVISQESSEVPSQESETRQIQVQRRSLPLAKRGTETRAMEFFFEGNLVRRSPVINRVNLSVPQEVSGAVELRSVLVGSGPIRARASHSQWLDLGEPDRQPRLEFIQKTQSLRASCRQASSIEIMHHGQTVGSIQGDEGQIQLAPGSLGSGPVRLRAIAIVEGMRVPGKPIVINL